MNWDSYVLVEREEIQELRKKAESYDQLEQKCKELTYSKIEYQRLDKLLRRRIGELKSDLKDAEADIEFYERHIKWNDFAK